MSESHNEALIRRAIDAWNANDWNALQELIAPDAELVAPGGWPETGSFKGWPAVRNLLHGLKEAWSKEHLEIVGVASRGDRVLVEARWYTRGEGSGLDIETTVWIAYVFEEGRVTRIEFTLEEEAARDAAGIATSGANG